MVSLTGHHIGPRSRQSSAASSNRSSVDENNMAGPEDETTVVDTEQGNVLSHIISQLRPGADLSRVTLPTFILEPRSMLERITNFMAHPETLLPTADIEDPTERFVSVVKFYLSGWHIKPPGVKKPLNPILGETFTCYWEYPDNTKGYYISEQTSHHPPKSSYFFMAPEHKIRIDGTLKPRSKFLGNSAASMMEGIAVLSLLGHGRPPHGERYWITQPNMYARGILFGKMKYELGDHSYVRCPELGLTADLDFKTKGYFSGTYNAIGGTIKRDATGEVLFELSGMWNGEMYITDKHTGKKTLLFDAAKSKPTPPTVRELSEQGEREAQKLWYKTAQAVIARDHVLATDEKSKIEETQREEAAKRVADGVEWRPRYFREVRGGPGGPEEGEEDLDWIINARIDGKTAEEQIKQILAIAPVIKGQHFSERMPIPPSRQSRQSMEDLRSRSQSEPHPYDQQPEEYGSVRSQNLVQQPQQPQPQQNNVVPPANENDLIDFGQNDTPLQTAQANAKVAQQAANPTQEVPISQLDEMKTPTPVPAQIDPAQRQLEEMLTGTASTVPAKNPSALQDFHNDLHKSLPEADKPQDMLKREDTDTHSVDEFVDAQE